MELQSEKSDRVRSQKKEKNEKWKGETQDWGKKISSEMK